MAVSASDVLAPGGPIEKTLFPGEGDGTSGSDLHNRVVETITKASVKASADGITTQVDDAVLHWTLHTLYKAAFILAVSRPAQEDAQMEVIGSIRFDKDQRDGLRELASYHEDAYLGIVDTESGTGTHAKGLPSYQTKQDFDW